MPSNIPTKFPNWKLDSLRGKNISKSTLATMEIGISLKDQKKIFNKFHRIYNPESPNVKGTGLGLYWVKEIVKYHGGKIGVYSAG